MKSSFPLGSVVLLMNINHRVPPLLYTHYWWMCGIWSDWWMEWSSVTSLDTSRCCWSSVHFVVLCCALTPQNGCTPLWVASYNGRTDVARLLIDHGANVNQQTTVCLITIAIHFVHHFSLCPFTFRKRMVTILSLMQVEMGIWTLCSCWLTEVQRSMHKARYHINKCMM